MSATEGRDTVSTAADVTVGLIGLGAMGEPMAARLAGAGYPLMLFDADAARAKRIAGVLRAKVAKSPKALAQTASVIITMLPTSAVVAAVLDGETGVLAGMKPDTLVIEMSSGVPTETQRLAALVAAHRGTLIDAPVSGGVGRAKTGELAIIVGGEDAAISRAEPILKAMGTSILRTGPVGSGHAMKALNNLVSAGGFLIGIEALLIGQRFGLDPATIVDVLNASTGMNNSTQKKFKQFVISRQFNSGFSLDLMLKDVSIALDLARETGTPVPFAAQLRELSAAARAMLGEGQDHTALAKVAERLANTELGVSVTAPGKSHA
jgi:3-hydroxyisobutyrate dehydrogenase